jgi:uncharacterized protein (TIGR04551 family)
MLRLLAAALAALTLFPAAARAQAEKKDAPAAQPPSAAPAPEVDARTKAAIQAAVDKATQQLRDEVRAEVQGAQSAAEFLGAVSEGPKLEFFEVDGYFRVRGQMFDDLDLRRGPDANGWYAFPVPLQNPESRSTLASANMRFRLEPTLNVSEQVRVRAQVDILDNYVLGSNVSAWSQGAGSPYPAPFFGSSRAVYPPCPAGSTSGTLAPCDPTADRPAIVPKRVWGEVQTPVGLLSFGRMPSAWGLGVLTSAGAGLEDDYGDTVDRLQFAIAPVSTPVGSLVFVPILDFDAEGPLYRDPRFGGGVGQPFDAEQGDDARTFALKIARVDTDDELRRKLERNEGSLNFGLYYNYRTQRWFYPQWYVNGTDPADTAVETAQALSPINRRAYAHFLDLWARWRKGRVRVETELVGVYGQIGDARSAVSDVATGQILLRQWGGVVQASLDVLPNKFSLGAEAGIASGDAAPGFGNDPFRGTNTSLPADVQRADGNPIEGPQYGGADRGIRNFRFNPAYRVDLVLWREILGQVTDAWYFRPRLRWDILPGLGFDFAAIYSQAMYASSTPSAKYKPLGIELDGKLSYLSGDGFSAWLDYGVFQPFAAFNATGRSIGRAHALGAGLAIKF